MQALVARLTTKASVPLLLIVYVALVIIFFVQFPNMAAGTSWTAGTAPSQNEIAWAIAFPALLAAFGISALLIRASATIERQRTIVAPWYVRLVNVVVYPGYIAAYLFRGAGPDMRIVFGCAIFALLAWLVAWPAYVVRAYG